MTLEIWSKTMGRDIEYETFNGKPLIAQSNGDTYRVKISKNHKKNKKGQSVDCYILYKNSKKIKVRMKLSDIAVDFYSEILDDNRLIDIPSDTPTKTTTEHITITPAPDGDTMIKAGAGVVGVGAEEHQLIDSKDLPYNKGKFEYSTKVKRQALTPEFICAEFLKLLAKDKHQISAICDMPALANLEDYMIPVEHKTFTVKELLQTFMDKPEPPSDEAARNAESYFGEFIKICGIHLQQKVTTIDQINGEAVQYYADEIKKVALDEKYIPSWLSKKQIKLLKDSPAPRHFWFRHRRGMVREIINNAIARLIHSHSAPEKHQLDNILFWTSSSKMKPVKRIKRIPKIISKDDYSKLLNQAIKEKHLKWECMLRLMLNCSFTLVDIRNLKKQDIKFDTCELIKNREKVETELRFAKLHPITMEVLNRYMKQYPNDTGHIFLNKNDNPVTVKSERISFNRLKKRACVDKEVQPRHMRKTTATIASGYPGITGMHVKLIMGEASDILQYYQNPTEIELISNACLYACGQYFGE
jgi:integrase